MSTNNGGPAFPYQPGDWTQDNTGMTLRDWFAGMALCGYWAQSSDKDSIRRMMPGGMGCSFEDAASDVYAMADAMLAEREK